jgi:hypothetical protein
LENNQRGSIVENRQIPLLHSILQFQEIPIHLSALYSSLFYKNCRK